MANLFNSVKGVRVKRNAFNLSHSRTFTGNMGQIIPCFVTDALPNSTWKVSTHDLTRFQAMLAPTMDTINAYVHFWALPYRLLDEDFTKFISDEMPEEDYDGPYFKLTSVPVNFPVECFSNGSLMQFLYAAPFTTLIQGVEQISRSDIKITTRPLVAYALLIKNWYKNEYISHGSNFDKALEAITDLSLLHGDCTEIVCDFLKALNGFNTSCCFPHAWAKDYFTSALPYVQKGEPVSISLAGAAPVMGNINITSDNIGITVDGSHGFIKTTSSSGKSLAYSAIEQLPMGSSVEGIDGNIIPNYPADPEGLRADLSEASAITINELRVANALQVFKERLMRFGSRYKEYIKGFFNQETDDARLFIPQWLGGGKLNVNISDVAQTSATANDSTTGSGTPLGTLAGKGTAFGTGFAGFTHHFKEHSLIIGVVFIQQKASYCQGLNKQWTKINDKYEFFNPSFEHLGEQEIKRHELYFSTSDTLNNGIFGYTPRYAEYKHWENEVLGQFRDSLSFWTFVRKFDMPPSLNANFIYTQYKDTTRPFAVQEVNGKAIDHVLNYMYFEVSMIGPMSKYGTPMLLA